MCGFADVVDRRRHRVDEPGADGRQQGVARTRRWSTSYPDVYLSTGLVAENHAREYGISREEQDAFALRSHQRALAAIEAGRFADEIAPLTFDVATPRTNGGTGSRATVTFAQDEGPRRDTSAEALAKLRPAFHATGTVTAGNSSQTSDGAAAVLVTSAALREGRAACSRWRASSRSRPPASSRSASASARCRRSARR